MSTFFDSSALVKLYVDEAGHKLTRRIDRIVVSVLARVEVPSAIWRKHRLAEMDAAVAARLVTGFEEDFLGTHDNDPRFRIVQVSPNVLNAAARLTGIAGLRAYDAVQLASAEAARDVEPGCDSFACFDGSLRDAAARSGFALYPQE